MFGSNKTYEKLERRICELLDENAKLEQKIETIKCAWRKETNKRRDEIEEEVKKYLQWELKYNDEQMEQAKKEKELIQAKYNAALEVLHALNPTRIKDDEA